MCKLLGTSKVLVRRHSQMVELSRYAAKALGLSQKDGFGFALKHQKGVYVEKYLSPDTCKGMGIVPCDIKKIPANLKIAVRQNRDFSYSGPYPETETIQGCFISHGRTATCDKTISNTHPFQGEDGNGGLWTIAHNGVVDCIGEKLETNTTCDSEHILNCFTKLEGVKSLKGQISGYAAILGINPQGEMVAFRDNSAPLYVSMIEGTGIFTLSTDPKHCEEFNELVCKHNRIKKSKITDSYLIEPYNFLTFHESGEISNIEFDAFARYSSNYQAVRTSLGSAGSTKYSQSDYYRSKGYSSTTGYGSKGYSDPYDDDYGLTDDDYSSTSKPSEDLPLPGLEETEDFCEDPAILEAIERGDLTVKDLASMAGEMDASSESFDLLQNRVSNKIKKLPKNRSLGDQAKESNK